MQAEKQPYIIPRRGPRLTFLAVGYGLVILFWLNREDTMLGPVIILGSGLAILTTALGVVRMKAGARLTNRQMIASSAVLGGSSGLLSAPLTVGLMFFKTALHGHGVPDYPFAIMGATLARTPAWGLAGLLLGLGMGLLLYAQPLKRSQSD